MSKRALFIGRFQPLHNGHLDALAQILSHAEKFDEIVIGIGSAEKSFVPENPLTCSERLEIWSLALQEKNIPRAKIWLIPIRDIERYSLWAFHVMEFCPDFQAVFSGSPLIRTLWEKALSGTGKQVFELEKRLSISATEVREKIFSGQELEAVLPQSAVQFLEKIQLRERLAAIRNG